MAVSSRLLQFLQSFQFCLLFCPGKSVPLCWFRELLFPSFNKIDLEIPVSSVLRHFLGLAIIKSIKILMEFNRDMFTWVFECCPVYAKKFCILIWFGVLMYPDMRVDI